MDHPLAFGFLQCCYCLAVTNDHAETAATMIATASEGLMPFYCERQQGVAAPSAMSFC